MPNTGKTTKVTIGSMAAGRVETLMVPAVAATYHEGQLLRYSNGRYTSTNNSPEIVCAQSTTLSSNGHILAYVTGSRLLASKVLAQDGTSLAMTVVLMRLLLQNGIIMEGVS